MTSTKVKLPQKERLKEIYEETLETGLNFTGDIEEIDYYSLLCKSLSENKNTKMFNCNLLSYKCKFQGSDAVFIIYCIPFSNKDDKKDPENKHMTEKVMDIIAVAEECFINVDHMKFTEVKEDKFSYLLIVKKVKGEE